MDNPRTVEKKWKKIIPAIPNKEIQCIFLNCPRIVKKKNYQATKQFCFMYQIIISHILNELLVLFLRKILITFTMILALFFFFFLSKILISFSGFFSPFFFFFFRKILISFACFFRVFLCVFDNSYLLFLYIEKKKCIKNIFTSLFDNIYEKSLFVCFIN